MFVSLTLVSLIVACLHAKTIHSGLYIFNGEDAEVGEYPWTASLQLSDSHWCGGSLISKDWVLTAAHCVKYAGPSPLTVVLGVWDLTGEFGDQTKYRVDSAITHPDHGWIEIGGGIASTNDIALLHLSEEANTDNEYIGIISLPSADDDFDGMDCWIAGWGYMGEGDFVPSNILQKVNVGYLSQETCRSFWGPEINDGMVCVGGKGSNGMCQGDSGGPLMCKVDDSWVLAGAASFAFPPCTDTSRPSVYARVTYFRDWIREVSGI